MLQIPVATADTRSLSGTVMAIEEPYGNLVTNVPASMLELLKPKPGEVFRLRAGALMVDAPLVHTFSDVKKGEVLLFVDSRGRLAAAVNQGNLASRLGADVPCAFTVERIQPR